MVGVGDPHFLITQTDRKGTRETAGPDTILSKKVKDGPDVVYGTASSTSVVN